MLVALLILVFSTTGFSAQGVNRTKMRLEAQAEQENTTRLLEDLLGEGRYSTHTRCPDYFMVGQSKVFKPMYLMYYIVKIIDLDATSEQISVSAYLKLLWTDRRLQWAKENYHQPDGNGILSLENVPNSNLSFPGLVLLNSVGSSESLMTEHQKVTVFATGVVRWERMVVLTSSCEMDVTFFPVDVQTCGQRLSSESGEWAFGIAASEEDYVATAITLYDDSMWSLKGSEDVRVLDPSKFHLTFQLTLHRKYQYYMNRILAPVTILATLVILSFFIPPDAGEKLGFGITLLLTFSVFQTMIDADLPASSNSTPLLTTAMVLLQVCSATSIVAAIIVLNLHHQGPGDGGNMPRLLRLFFFTVLAKLTCHTHLVNQVRLKRTEPREENFLTDIPENAEEGSSSTSSHERGVEWKVAALIVDRLLMYVCLVAMATVYGALFYRLHQASYGRHAQNLTLQNQEDYNRSRAHMDKLFKFVD